MKMSRLFLDIEGCTSRAQGHEGDFRAQMEQIQTPLDRAFSDLFYSNFLEMLVLRHVAFREPSWRREIP
jgi:hypothetical protein